MPTPVTHVLFDMDGLLLNTENAYTDVNNEILAPYGKVQTWDVKAKMMGSKERDAAEFFVRHYELPLSADEYIAQRRRKLEERFPQSVPLPGVIKLVTHLKQHAVPMCVATSSHRMGFELKTSRNQALFALFDGNVVCGDDSAIKEGKPAPDIFLEAAKKIGFAGMDYSQCLVFEDSLLGAQAGIAACAQVVLIPDENLDLDPEVVANCAKVLKSMKDFVPEEFGLPAYP
ncbi:HAD-like domain-containing protein [Chytriomyces sp. MP71]|nr:HAD-like domain-containing protein [Chytriomyces sp. MP71]